MAYLMQPIVANWTPITTGDTGAVRVDMFRAPYPVIISKVSADVEGTATGVTVTLLKNGVAVSSGIVLTTSTWGTKSFTTGLTAAIGDAIGFKVTAGGQLSLGSQKNLTVQLDVKIDQWYSHMDN
jgi:hypothetical protein